MAAITTSVFELLKIGPGLSSSHTSGGAGRNQSGVCPDIHMKTLAN